MLSPFGQVWVGCGVLVPEPELLPLEAAAAGTQTPWLPGGTVLVRVPLQSLCQSPLDP